MSSSPPVELVVASFDDPILAGLLAERGGRPGVRSGLVGGTPPVDAGVVFLVARQISEPVGCAGLRRLGDDTAEVDRVYVRPEFRGRGISRLLLAGVEDLARRRGFAVARLEAGDLRAAGLYASSGYVRIAPFGRHPARSVCFEKSLHTPVPGGRR
jgi:putative acetyltransferase